MILFYVEGKQRFWDHSKLEWRGFYLNVLLDVENARKFKRNDLPH